MTSQAKFIDAARLIDIWLLKKTTNSFIKTHILAGVQSFPIKNVE
jgi:hypothetical protein